MSRLLMVVALVAALLGCSKGHPPITPGNETDETGETGETALPMAEALVGEFGDDTDTLTLDAAGNASWNRGDGTLTGTYLLEEEEVGVAKILITWAEGDERVEVRFEDRQRKLSLYRHEDESSWDYTRR